MRFIDTLVIHCSDSEFGDAALITTWHLDRGFTNIGYHKVILNAYKTSQALKDRLPDPYSDGMIEEGRMLEEIGAHCEGHNTGSIGICLIGKDHFTGLQLMSLRQLVEDLKAKFPIEHIYGHYELDQHGKSCPNLEMTRLREFLT